MRMMPENKVRRTGNENRRFRRKYGIKKQLDSLLSNSGLVVHFTPHSAKHCYFEVSIDGIVILSGFTDIKYFNSPTLLNEKIREALPELIGKSIRGGLE